MKISNSIRVGALLLVTVMVLAFVSYAAPVLTGESSRTTQTLRSGVVYTQIKTPSTADVYKTQSINVIEVDLSQRDLYIDSAFGNMNNMFASSTVKNTMTNFKTNNPSKTPIAAVNGCPWIVSASANSSQGTKSVKPWTMGFTYCNGEIYCTDGLENRAAVGISEDFVPIYGMPTCELTLVQGNKVATADEINQQPLDDKMIIYTDRIMGSTNNFVTDDAYEILINFGFDYTLSHGTTITGTIAAKYGPSDSSNPAKISANQMVVTARGSSIAELEQFTVGQSITLSVKIHDRLGDSLRWQNAQSIQGGFFPLILNGQVMNGYGTGLYPATIVGSNRDGKFVMITLDGRNNNGGCQGLYSAAMSNKLMTELGMYNALLLDGGGSATMVVNKNGTNTTVNTPEDNSTYNRPVYGSWILSYGPQRVAQGDTSIESLTAGPNVDPTHVTFPDEYMMTGLVHYSNNTNYEWENESLKLTSTGTDSYVGFNYLAIRHAVQADDYKYATIVYKLPSTNTGTSANTEMFFVSAGNSAGAGMNVTSNLASNNGKWQAVTFNASSISSFTGGRISELRFDYFVNDRIGDSIYIHDIILSQTAVEGSTAGSTIAGQLNAPDQTTFSFNMNGHGEQVPAQTLLRGQSPSRPADPTEFGWTFTGWYTSKYGSVQYDFSSVPVKNTTIVAKWTEWAKVTLSYDMGGHGTQIPSQSVYAGYAPTSVPDTPTDSEWTFDGWFTSATGSTPFNFAAAMNEDKTAYAHWTSSQVTLTFDMGGHGAQVAAQVLDAGASPAEPAAPSALGWRFDGWFTEANGSSAFDFSAAMSADATAYARWTMLGDVDGSGQINAADVVKLMRYLVGYEDADFIIEQADYNLDGKTNNKDVLLIMLYLVNND